MQKKFLKEVKKLIDIKPPSLQFNEIDTFLAFKITLGQSSEQIRVIHDMS